MSATDEVREKIIDAARAQRTINYGDIAPLLGLDMGDPADRVRIGHILGEISKEEHAAGRPMLSVVVTLKGEGRPGHGFFELALELGLTKGADEETFFIRELTRVFQYWSQT